MPISLSLSLSLLLSLSLHLSPSLPLSVFLSLSLSLTGEEGVRTLFTGQRERERKKEEGRELHALASLSFSLSMTGDVPHSFIHSVSQSVSQHA